MGSRLSVLNETENVVAVKVYFAGDPGENSAENIPINSMKTFNLENSFSKGKTIIVTVDEKAFRAVRINSKVRIKLNSYGALQIDVIGGFDYQTVVTEIPKAKIRELYWNFGDIDAVSDAVTKYNNISSIINCLVDNISEIAGAEGGLLVGKFVGGSNAARFSNKIIQNTFKGYFKIQINKAPDTNTSEQEKKLLKIRNQSLAICRSKAIDYELYKENWLVSEKLKFLNSLLKKLTQTDVLPFLENCGLKDAIPQYVIVITIILELLSEIKNISNADSSEFVWKKYREFFFENLEKMIEESKELIQLEVGKPKTEGFLLKLSEISHEKKSIYILKGFLKSKLFKRMEAVRDAYINNHIYQVNVFLGEPSRFLETLK